MIEEASERRRTGFARPACGLRDCTDALGGHAQLPAHAAHRRKRKKHGLGVTHEIALGRRPGPATALQLPARRDVDVDKEVNALIFCTAARSRAAWCD